MNIETYTVNGKTVAAVTGGGQLITDAQSALDLLMTVRHETGAERMAVCKEAVAEDFFILRSGSAGEILEKFVTYRMKLSIYGDYSRYTSKPLRDFIRESNRGSQVFFTDGLESAVEKLASV